MEQIKVTSNTQVLSEAKSLILTSLNVDIASGNVRSEFFSIHFT